VVLFLKEHLKVGVEGIGMTYCPQFKVEQSLRKLSPMTEVHQRLEEISPPVVAVPLVVTQAAVVAVAVGEELLPWVVLEVYLLVACQS